MTRYLLVIIAIGSAFAGSSRAQTTKPEAASHLESEVIGRPSSAGVANSAAATRGTSAADVSDNSLDFRRVAWSLAIVLGLVFAIRWSLRWFFPASSVARSSQVMKVLSRSVLAPKQQLLLVQVGRRLIVVGDCGTQMNALAQIDEPDEVASLLGQLRAEPADTEPARPFAPLLGRARQAFDEPPKIEESEASDEISPEEPVGIQTTKEEIAGLTEKIRMLSRHFGNVS